MTVSPSRPQLKPRSSSHEGSKQIISGYDSDGLLHDEKNSPSRDKTEIQSPVELSAVLYKRRGGLGWNVENNWVPRLFKLHGPIFKYYETTDLKSTDLTKPRNLINLSKEETIADMHVKNKDGAPSNFLLTLNLYTPLGGKKRWEISFKTREQQEDWYEAIRRFDGKPEHRKLHQKKIMFKTYLDEVRTFSQIDEVDRVVDSMHDINEKVGILSIPLTSFISKGQRDKNVIVSFLIINASALIVRYASFCAFWFSIAILNLTISYLCAHVTTKSIKRLITHGEEGYETDDNEKESETPEAFSSIVPAGSTFPRAEAKSEELKKVIDDNGLKSATAIKACAATTTNFEEHPHTYWNVEASRFNLRIGPNYKKNKQKAPSGTALYNLYAMDLVKAESNLDSAEKGFQIPEIQGVTDVPTGHAYVPPMIVLVVNIPSGEPSMFQGSTSGPSYVAVLYLVITDKTRMALADLENSSPAVKLLAAWCQHAENDDEWKGRFKFLAVLDNIENLGLPSFIAGFNGKPVLINKSGKFTRHSNYIEMGINVHAWAFIAKKGLYTLLPKFPEIVVNIGATIEGRSDEEQPETLLGGVRAMQIQLDKIRLDSNNTLE